MSVQNLAHVIGNAVVRLNTSLHNKRERAFYLHKRVTPRFPAAANFFVYARSPRPGCLVPARKLHFSKTELPFVRPRRLSVEHSVQLEKTLAHELGVGHKGGRSMGEEEADREVHIL